MLEFTDNFSVQRSQRLLTIHNDNPRNLVGLPVPFEAPLQPTLTCSEENASSFFMKGEILIP